MELAAPTTTTTAQDGYKLPECLMQYIQEPDEYSTNELIEETSNNEDGFKGTHPQQQIINKVQGFAAQISVKPYNDFGEFTKDMTTLLEFSHLTTTGKTVKDSSLLDHANLL